ncbi:MAG: RNA 2',3'-cyclic phosphodiesterase [Planctomycetota bacterium]|nr:MAG: RNA 2',3'-cyclic phosphodiesterase [Planctomycetota bacterium]
MRVFLALRLPEAVAKDLAARAHAALGAHLDELRLVPAANLHVTLHFLGVTGAEVLAGLPAEIERELAGHVPLDLAVRGTGGFPDGRAKRVLWAGVGGEPDALARLGELAAACRRAVAASGHALPEREEPFVPHVTIARSRAGLPAPRAWRELALDLRWRAERVELLESQQVEGRTRYPSLSAHALG